MTQNMGVKLTQNGTLTSGQCLLSPAGAYQLTMELNGNLVFAPTAGGPPVLVSGTVGNIGAFCSMLLTGDFTLFDASGTALLHSGTGGNVGAYVQVDDFGNMSILNAVGDPLDPPWVNGPMLPA